MALSRSKISIFELDLQNSATLRAIATAKKYSCSHGSSSYECGSCFQDKIIKLLEFEGLFAICANQFLSKPIPAVIETEVSERYECKTLEEARKYLRKDKVPDETILAILRENKPVIVQSGTVIKRYSIDAKAVEEAVAVTNTILPALLHDLVASVGPEDFDSALLEKLNHPVLFDKMTLYFRRNKEGYAALAKQCRLPLEAMTDIVLPRVLGLQAKAYLDAAGKELSNRYPPLKDLFDLAKPVFKQTDTCVKFFDEYFLTYDVHRVIASESKLSVVPGPKNSQNVVRMLENTVFNARYPINQMLVVADTFKDKATDEGDLINYFLLPVGTKIEFTTKKEVGAAPAYDAHVAFEMTILENDGDPVKLKSPLEEKRASDEARSATIRLMVKQLVTGEERVLTVHLFKMPKNGSLELTHSGDSERFYEVFKQAQKQSLGIQSSGAAVGRSSVIVLAFELAKFFKANATRIDNSNINRVIAWVLKSIRSYNPGLISEEADYFESVRLACVLFSHAYRLKKSFERLRGSGVGEEANASRSDELPHPRLHLEVSGNETTGPTLGTSLERTGVHSSSSTPRPGSGRSSLFSAGHDSPDASGLTTTSVAAGFFQPHREGAAAAGSASPSARDRGVLGGLSDSVPPSGSRAAALGTKVSVASGTLSGSNGVGTMVGCKGVEVRRDYEVKVDPYFSAVIAGSPAMRRVQT